MLVIPKDIKMKIVVLDLKQSLSKKGRDKSEELEEEFADISIWKYEEK